MGSLKNFEFDAVQRQNAETKYKQRLSLRNEYWKQITNPARHATGDGGHLFDPAFYRHQAARVSFSEHFKPTGKSLYMGFYFIVAPIAIFYVLMRNERDSREKRYRNGEVAYTDRQFKFVS